MQALFDYYEGEEERCGFIVAGEIIEFPNVHPEPTQGFQIDDETILRYIDDIEGIWHTHPGASSVLSGADKEYISWWPNVHHYIIGADGISEYKVDNGVVLNANHTTR